MVQLAVSLAVISVAVGVGIWVVFRPIHRLARVAEEVGAGNLDVQIDSGEMEGELEVLTKAFNEMTTKLRGARDELENTVAERTKDLRESEERLRTVVISAPVVLFAVDRNGIFTLSEGQGLEAMGLVPGEVVGESVFEKYRDVRQVVDDVRRALAGDRFTSVVEVAGRTFESYYSPVLNDAGTVVGVIGVATDITERKLTEDALKASEEEYRTLYEQSRDAIFISSGEGNVTHANQAALDLFGLALDEAMGSDVGDRFVDPADRDRFRAAVRDGSVRDFECRLRKEDGTEMSCLLTATRRLDAAGNSLGVQGVIRDITEREESERTQRELAVLGERNRVAREIHDTLAQGFTGIVLQLEAAEQVLDGDHTEAEEHLERAKALARDSLQEARRSVWDLLPRTLEERSLDDAIRREVDAWSQDGREQATFTKSGRQLELPSEVQAALLRISQESLTNVRRHANAETVAVDLAVATDSVRIRVHDDGHGFDTATARSGQLEGFGLACMEQRVRLLGGEILITSEPGEGTTVEATIPLA